MRPAQGAMQIRFTTKRGTDQYHFHVLEQFGNEDLNANTWFNNVAGIRRPKSGRTIMPAMWAARCPLCCPL